MVEDSTGMTAQNCAEPTGHEVSGITGFRRSLKQLVQVLGSPFDPAPILSRSSSPSPLLSYIPAMTDDEAERVDWGNDDDEHPAISDSYANLSPTDRYGGPEEDAEDAVSLGGDDDYEREYYADQAVEEADDECMPTTSV